MTKQEALDLFDRTLMHLRTHYEHRTSTGRWQADDDGDVVGRVLADLDVARAGLEA